MGKTTLSIIIKNATQSIMALRNTVDTVTMSDVYADCHKWVHYAEYRVALPCTLMKIEFV
jgi:hypothetical protein